MATQPHLSPPRRSRQLVQVMMEMNSRLRRHGVTIALAAPDAVEQLIQAAESLEDDTLSELRQRLMAVARGEADRVPALPTDPVGVPASPRLAQESDPTAGTPPAASPDGAAEPTEPTAGHDPSDSAQGAATDPGETIAHTDATFSEAVKVFLRATQGDRLQCERCQTVLIAPEAPRSDREPVTMTCTCGLPLQVEADRRRYQRKPTHLSGHYTEPKRGESGAVVVENISFGGLRLRTTEAHSLAPRDEVQVQFTLDDESHSVICVPVSVRHVAGHTMGVRFAATDAFDPRLAAYLMR